jgi:protein O-mannosyl-transferase
MPDDAPEGAGLRLPVAVLLVVAAALAASVTSLGNGFALDDLPMIVDNARIRSLADPLGFFEGTYWATPGLRAAAWRPLTLLAFAVQYALGDGGPWAFHATSVVLNAAVSVAVLLFLRALLPAGPALIGALLFAVHPVHVEAVANAVGQAELWVALFVVAALALYAYGRRGGEVGIAGSLGIVACFALALGFKEHALVLPALLLALEVAVLRTSCPAPASWVRVRALHYALASIAVLWFVTQMEQVGGVNAGAPHAALLGRTMGERSWIMLALVPEFLRLFVWPVRLYADYAPQLVPVLPTPVLAHVWGAVCVFGWAAALGLAWRRLPVVAFGLLWLPIALALVANVLVPTGILLAERTLLLPSVGVVMIAAGLGAALWPRLVSAPPGVPRVLLVATAGLIVLAASHSAQRSVVWKDNLTLVTTLVTDAPQSSRAQFWLADELIQQQELASGEVALRRAMALWPEYPNVPLALAATYQSTGHCDAALPLFERVIALDPTNASAHFGYAGCLLNVGRLTDARMEALRGAAKARSATAFRIVLFAADSALAATDSVRGNNWWVRRQARLGGPGTPAGG